MIREPTIFPFCSISWPFAWSGNSTWAIPVIVFQRAAIIAAGLVVLAGAVVLAWVAPWIGLAAAVGSAVAWCQWLERHPERVDVQTGMSRPGGRGSKLT